MGLDMYAFQSDLKPSRPVDFEIDKDSVSELKYWRKHPNLHGWMESLYRKKGGESEVFNCVNLELNANDLDDLEKMIKENSLPSTQGFFFGQSFGDEDEIKRDLEFIKEAKECLTNGKTVFYWSWW